MGSLRNPIGPLPSSIYWRRRAVALAVLALLVLLVVWALSLGNGDSGKDDQGKGSGGNGPASSITPGPTDSGPAISERPGGRDEVGEGGEDGGGSEGSGGGSDGGGDGTAGSGGNGSSGWVAGDGSGSGDGGSTGADGTGGTGGSGGSGGSAGSGGDVADGSGGSGGSGGGSVRAGVLPADTKVPDCGPSNVEVTLRTVKKTYASDEKPQFQLVAKNESGDTCKIDLGRTASVVTITGPDDKKFWASDDCPGTAAPFLAEVPGDGESMRTLTWLRKASTEGCGTPSPESAKPGTYKVKVEVNGLKTVRTEFKLKG